MSSGIETGRSKGFAGTVIVLAAALLFTFASEAEAGKIVDRIVTGTSKGGSAEGLFRSAGGIAINDPAIADGTTDPLGASTDGYLYVVDEGNHRVQVFDDSGQFRFAFGRNVVKAGGAGNVVGVGNEQQTVAAFGSGGTFALRVPSQFDPAAIPLANEFRTVSVVGTGGTFTLAAFGDDGAKSTTVPIARNAPASSVQAALESLALVGAGNVAVSGPAGGPWEIEFVGTLAATDFSNLVGDAGGLTGEPTSVSVVDGEVTAPIARSATAEVVDGALEALASIGVGNVAVSGPAGGPWAVEFTGNFADSDVKDLIGDASGLTGSSVSVSVTTTAEAGSGFEICAVPGDCRAGSPGQRAGEFDTPKAIAINQQTGDVYVTDGRNERIQQFAADGSFIRAWGWDVIAPGGPGNIAINDVQRVTVSGATGGSFELNVALRTFNGATSGGTGLVAFNASAATLDAALEAVSLIGAGNANVTGPAGGPWDVEFTGALATLDIAEMFPSKGTLSGPSPAIGVKTLVPGGGFEKCTSQCKAGGVGGEGSEFNRLNDAAEGIAIDPAPPHHLFVIDPRNKRVHEYEPDGDFVRLWGWNVVKTGQPGNVGGDFFPGNNTNWPLGASIGETNFEICGPTAAGVCQAGQRQPSDQGASMGVAPGMLSQPNGITVDGSTGLVYVGDQGRVHRFDSDAMTRTDLLRDFLPGIDTGLDILVVSPANGNLLAGGQPDLGEFDLATDTAVRTDTHLAGAGSGIRSLAVDTGSGDFYFTAGNRLFAADDDGAPPPAVSIDDPSGTVSGPNVTFSGSVTPGGPAGFDVTYNFQYRRVGSGDAGWITVPGLDNPLGDGNSPVAVSDSVTDLEPNTQYEVRLAARKPFGNPETVSNLEVFTSAAIPPSATTTFPRRRSATAALLTGKVNPNNSPTSYYFEWGTDTSYGNRAPMPDGEAGAGFGARGVTALVEGLAPETTYHYRVIADNGVEVSPGVTTVVGADVEFTTPPVSPAQGERAYEMVTPPFKVVRSLAAAGQVARENPNPGLPSLNGDAIAWGTSFLPLTDDVGNPISGDHRLSRRTADGWVASTRNTGRLLILPSMVGSPATFLKQNPIGSSGDLETMTWGLAGGEIKPEYGALLPFEGAVANRLYTRRDGTGADGFTPWLTNPEAQSAAVGFPHKGVTNVTNNPSQDKAIFNDAGTAMARWGHYRGLASPDPSDNQQLSGEAGGSTIYHQFAENPDDLPGAAKDLVNECTGTGGTATLLPSRVGTGSSTTDMIGTRTCAQSNVTSVRGATVGAGLVRPDAVDGGGLGGTAATAMSDDGRRIFFTSPDIGAVGVPVAGCANGAAAATNCPPQLFVRSYDGEGQPTVRWISRSRSAPASANGYEGAMIAGQRIAEMGAGAGFQGASRDGSVVYFKTNAPLTPDDPNGGASITTASAQNTSWDLYRYELPADPGQDPDGGVLTRISGGPDGTADPGTNVEDGSGATLRYLSDDGRRAYFVTSAPLAGADQTAPLGGGTVPGGAVANQATRNLYLFDASETGAERYKFIARIPFAKGSAAGVRADGLDVCASFAGQVDQHMGGGSARPWANCFRGTKSGRSVIFATTGALTEEDDDSSLDVYLYDAEVDELVRVSAPQTSTEPYPCQYEQSGSTITKVLGTCNANLSRGGSMFFTTGDWQSSRGWAGMRYMNIAEDADGVVSVFFESKARLIPEDTNGDYMDVYQWRGGELSLISRGDRFHDSWFSGNSVDGRDVFFVTGDRIDPRELDPDDLDIYDARIGGGFPYTPPAEPCDVLALQCEIGALPAPNPGAATTGAARAGNVPPKRARCAKGKVKRKGRCVKPKKRTKKKASRKAGKTRGVGR